MDKQMVIIGAITIAIGLTFLGYNFLDPTDEQFLIGTAIWAVGQVALILGLTVFRREEGFNMH